MKDICFHRVTSKYSGDALPVEENFDGLPNAEARYNYIAGIPGLRWRRLYFVVNGEERQLFLPEQKSK